MDVALNTAAATPADMDLANPTLYLSSALDFLEIPLARGADTFWRLGPSYPQYRLHPQAGAPPLVTVCIR